MIVPEKYHIAPFVRLGELLHAELAYGSLEPVIAAAVARNPWFSRDSATLALRAVIAQMLDPEKLSRWLKAYDALTPPTPKTVGIIMAGNIPLAGFFDLLCVCVCGHRCAVKPSSKDKVLIDYVIGRLMEADPTLGIETLSDDTPPDALIATGSDNTNCYFRARYAGIPTLLRGSRTSIAVLSGTESDGELEALARDTFQYNGMGCRNVSHLFIPEGYNVDRLSRILSAYPMASAGYLGSYRQARAMALLNGDDFRDGGFFILNRKQGISPILSELYYSYYSGQEEVYEWLRAHEKEIQCVVSASVDHPRRTGFGQAQEPALDDYPDGIDTIHFLHTI